MRKDEFALGGGDIGVNLWFYSTGLEVVSVLHRAWKSKDGIVL